LAALGQGFFNKCGFRLELGEAEAPHVGVTEGWRAFSASGRFP
jgi:hypothetical protein